MEEEEKKKLRVALFGHEPIRYIIHDDDLWYLWEDECKILGINDKALGKLDSDKLRPFDLDDGSSALFVNQWCTAYICFKRRKPVFKAWMNWCCKAMMEYDHKRLADMEHAKREAYFEAQVSDHIKERFKDQNFSYEWMYVFQMTTCSITEAFEWVLHEHGINMTLEDVVEEVKRKEK